MVGKSSFLGCDAVVTDVSKGQWTPDFNNQAVQEKRTAWPLKMEAPRTFETPGTTASHPRRTESSVHT